MSFIQALLRPRSLLVARPMAMLTASSKLWSEVALNTRYGFAGPITVVVKRQAAAKVSLKNVAESGRVALITPEGADDSA